MKKMAKFSNIFEQQIQKPTGTRFLVYLAYKSLKAGLALSSLRMDGLLEILIAVGKKGLDQL